MIIHERLMRANTFILVGLKLESFFGGVAARHCSLPQYLLIRWSTYMTG